MSLRLSTLEGLDTMSNRLLSRPAPRRMIQPGRTHLVNPGFALYGTEETEDFDALTGWWTDLKKGVSKAADTVVNTGSDIGRAVGHIAADTLRTVAVPVGQSVGAVIGTAMGTGGTPAAAGQGAGGDFLNSISSLFGGGQSAPVATINPATGQVMYSQPAPNYTPLLAMGGVALLAVLILKKK